MIKPEEALSAVRTYIDGLNLNCEVSYGKVSLMDGRVFREGPRRLLGLLKGKVHEERVFPEHYVVDINFRDGDKGLVSSYIQVDGNGALDPQEIEREFTRGRILEKLAENRAHYIVVRTSDLDAAQGIAEILYSRTDVTRVSVFDRKWLEEFKGLAGLAFSHGMKRRIMAVMHKNKFREEKQPEE